jgi:hypothetical protein
MTRKNIDCVPFHGAYRPLLREFGYWNSTLQCVVRKNLKRCDAKILLKLIKSGHEVRYKLASQSISQSLSGASEKTALAF